MLFRKPGAVSWLVVFLGNPGLRYEGTRHNAGFMAADATAKAQNVVINKSRFKALTAVCTIGGENVMLMKPQTYMNLSGEAVIQAVNFYKIPPEHILVVSDDIDLPVGKLRLRASGSAGGAGFFGGRSFSGSGCFTGVKDTVSSCWKTGSGPGSASASTSRISCWPRLPPYSARISSSEKSPSAAGTSVPPVSVSYKLFSSFGAMSFLS